MRARPNGTDKGAREQSGQANAGRTLRNETTVHCERGQGEPKKKDKKRTEKKDNR
jgi:hypothetical protein